MYICVNIHIYDNEVIILRLSSELYDKICQTLMLKKIKVYLCEYFKVHTRLYLCEYFLIMLLYIIIL